MTNHKELRNEMRKVLQNILSDMREKLSKHDMGFHEDYFNGMDLAEGVAIMVIDGCRLAVSEVEA